MFPVILANWLMSHYNIIEGSDPNTIFIYSKDSYWSPYDFIKSKHGAAVLIWRPHLGIITYRVFGQPGTGQSDYIADPESLIALQGFLKDAIFP